MMKVSEILKNRYNINLDVWINLAPYTPVRNPEPLTVEFLEQVEEQFGGRVLSCISDYDVTDGLRYSPEELIAWQRRGVMGYKIWAPVVVGPDAPEKDRFTIYEPNYRGLDQPANEPTFRTMARIGLVGSCIHIGQPHPRRWKNPVHFWTAINSWERVLDRHPDLTVVMAHMFNLFYSDEQLDYLSYILETYPNVYLDLGGRIKDFHSMDREHLRDFFIKYADRILFGTDMGTGFDKFEEADYLEAAEKYFRSFRSLETDAVIPARGNKSKEHGGLALPISVLERIYFRNALRMYPRTKTVLEGRGYTFQ